MKITNDDYNAMCRESFALFFQEAWTQVEPTELLYNWHISLIAEYLEAVEAGDIRRLIINIPPRTSKTLLCNVMFPSWVMGRNPKASFIGVSYAQRLSENIAYKNRSLMETDWYGQLFPNCRLDINQSQKSNFMTTKKGVRYSSSVGGSVTGMGGDYIVVDDPVNPQEALSDVQRVAANEWLDQTLYTRLNDQKTGRIIIIMQRLHTDDPTGHALNNGEWEHLVLPAYTPKPIQVKGPRTGTNYRYEGYLHEERMGADELQDLQNKMGSYAFAGQFLQSPVPLGGGEFRKDWVNYYASQTFDASNCNIYITVDPANEKKKYSDYTAMAVWALAPDNNYYLIDGVKERLNPTERIDKIFELHRKWNDKTGKPPKVGWEKYGFMTDIHYIEKKQKEISYRFPIEELKKPSGMAKEDAIRRLIPVMERGQVWLPNDMYHKDHKGLPQNFMSDILEQEMLTFPNATHDDFIDAMAMIFDMPHVFPRKQSFEAESGINMGNDPVIILDI